MAPQERLVTLGEEDATHPRPAGVGGTEESWAVGNDFREVGGAGCEVAHQELEVSEVAPDVWCHSDAVAVRPLQTELERAEEAGAAWHAG